MTLGVGMEPNSASLAMGQDPQWGAVRHWNFPPQAPTPLTRCHEVLLLTRHCSAPLPASLGKQQSPPGSALWGLCRVSWLAASAGKDRLRLQCGLWKGAIFSHLSF